MRDINRKQGKSQRGGKISARFRNINVTLFILVSALIFAVMFFVLQNITDTVSKDYAKLYSANTVGTLNTYFGGEIALITKAAHSNAVMNWFEDEENQEKKLAAYEEMLGIIDVLSSKHLYIGVEKTLHEFTVEEDFTLDELKSFATLSSNYFDDAWYFECAASDKEYLLNVDIDKIFKRKRVWLNYKVTRNDAVLGVLCTGLEFSQLIEKLFAEYDNKSVRGLLIDENGIIHMDSTMLNDDNFMHYASGEEYRIEDEFLDVTLLSAVNTYIEGIDGYFNTESPTEIISLSTGQYQYATIAPIASTTWSVVTFYNSSSLFNMTKLLPLFIFMPAMFIVFIVSTGFASRKLIFAPFEKLALAADAISQGDIETEIASFSDAKDELGVLAQSLHRMVERFRIYAIKQEQTQANAAVHSQVGEWLKDGCNVAQIFKNASDMLCRRYELYRVTAVYINQGRPGVLSCLERGRDTAARGSINDFLYHSQILSFVEGKKIVSLNAFAIIEQKAVFAGHGTASVCVVPIRCDNALFGYFILENMENDISFGEGEEKLLTYTADIIAEWLYKSSEQADLDPNVDTDTSPMHVESPKNEPTANTTHDKLISPGSDTLSSLRSIDRLEVDMAIEAMGGLIDIYERSAKLLAELVPGVVLEMDSCVHSDINAFAINVHGMKGSLNNIGANALGLLASKLENAAKSGDASFCAEHYPQFKNGLTELSRNLLDAFRTVQSDKPTGGVSELAAAIEKVKTATKAYDCFAAIEEIRPLMEFSYENEIDERLNGILKPLETFDCETALNLIIKLERLLNEIV